MAAGSPVGACALRRRSPAVHTKLPEQMDSDNSCLFLTVSKVMLEAGAPLRSLPSDILE